MLVCVLGLGTIGLPTAEYIRNKGLKVFGYDISQEAVMRAKQKGISASSEWRDIPEADVYIICVSTWNSNGEPDLSPVFKISKKISSRTDKDILVSIESTLIPGTSRKIYDSIFHGNVKLVHVPHRYWAEDPLNHGVRQLRVIGGINKESLDSGIEFYKNLLEIPLHEVPSIEISEICKISENAYRYVQIAFAEELRMICEDLGLDFKMVREACNTKWNTEILDARDGIGGRCLPKDIHLLASLSKYNTLLRASKEVDKQYRQWLKKKGC
ncbi:MAG: NAD(P)-binding domain-containing protein [Candidatus Bathyarchaeia archaeon]